MVFCPFCDSQGLIDRAKVIGSNIQIYICEECDTMWNSNQISEENSINYRKFMNELGLKGLWEELVEVERL